MLVCAAPLFAPLFAEEPGPSPLHKMLMGHWIADKDSHLHFYYSQRRRVFENNHPDSDAALSIAEYQLWDEWPETRTVVLAFDDGTHGLVILVISFSEDGKSANLREKTTAGWTKAFKLRRMDDKTHPVAIPVKLKVLDMENGLSAP